MLFIKRGRKKYPVVNTPVSKEFLIECEDNYPKGFFINNGKKLKFSAPHVNYNRFDIKIDFLNSLKVAGVGLIVFYFFVLKKKVVSKFSEKKKSREEILNEIRDNLKKKGQINDDPFGDSEEE
tara:strand:+ start:215 stop:583 length:369 start_codon:yes stop_codon:yes gene_type:complete